MAAVTKSSTWLEPTCSDDSMGFMERRSGVHPPDLARIAYERIIAEYRPASPRFGLRQIKWLLKLDSSDVFPTISNDFQQNRHLGTKREIS